MLNYKKPLIPLDLNKVFFIVIHHIEAVFADAEDIHRWHLENGWNGAGYNEYIKKDGTLYVMRGDNIGAHTEGMNSKSYGIALEGNYNNTKTIPESQRNKLIERLRYHKDRMPNKVEIVPHSKFTKTDCPGIYFPMSDILNSVDESFEDDINKLYSHGIINSKDYWITNCKEGSYPRGDFVKILISNIAKKL